MSMGAARGPLGSVLAQWAVVGLGALGILGNDDVSSSILRGARFAFLPRDVTDSGRDQRSPIVIHNLGATGGNRTGFVWSMVQLAVGAGVCWGSYIVFSSCLPEAVKDMLPVTRKCFDQAVTSLGRGIVNVRDVLTEQILGISEKQEELSSKQDETHCQVLEIKNEIGDVKLDLGSIYQSMQRCESSLSEAERRQSYTARGVRLLVRCVSAMMPANATFVGELDKFSMAGDELYKEQDDQQQHVVIPSNQPETVQQERLTFVQPQSENPQQYTPLPQQKQRLSSISQDGSPESERYSSPVPEQKRNDLDFQAMVEMMRSIQGGSGSNVVAVKN